MSDYMYLLIAGGLGLAVLAAVYAIRRQRLPSFRVTEIELHFGLVKVRLKSDELEKTLGDIITEMKSITSRLRSDEKELLRKIMAQPTGSMAVRALFVNFQRGSPEHETLRRLRDAQFVRPLEGGTWEDGKHIEIKPFGQLMWAKIGERTLFE